MGELLLAIGLLAAGVFLDGLGLRDLLRSYRRTHWPEVMGAITGYRRGTTDSSGFMLHASFAYRTPRGRFHGNVSRRFSYRDEGSLESMFLRQFPVGRPVRVWYDPDEPFTFQIEKPRLAFPVVLLLGVTVTALGVLALLQVIGVAR